MLRFGLLAVVIISTFIVAVGGDSGRPAVDASPGAITLRDPNYGFPHIYADTDLEVARENGREIAKDRLGQIILLSRVGRGTLFQAFGALSPGTFNDDVEVRRDGYTSSELNNMYDKMPADLRAQILEYAKGVNDTIDDVYAGLLPEPLEVNLLKSLLGLGDDLFGNATNISDQVDPFYLAPGGADPEHPDGGFQFTPELVVSILILQVRNFGSENFGEVSRLDELNALVAKFPSTGEEIWDDLNFRNDPLAPVSVPDATTPGFGGPLAWWQQAPGDDYEALVQQFPRDDYESAVEPVQQSQAHREEFARALGAWPALGSYSWQIDGDRSATGNPWVGGFPQTGIQTPSIMHYVEMRSAEGSDHRIQARGMEFAGAPAILIGQTDSVGWTSTTAQLKNVDFYLDKLILENTDALKYDDEGTPAPMSLRTEQVLDLAGNGTPVVIWRTHERAGNGGSRTVDGFRGDASGTADSGTATALTDTGAFGAGFAGGYVAIMEGTGFGQMRPVLSSTADTLTLDGGDAWTVTPDDTSEYVAVQSGNDLVAISRERAFWLEESTAALGFSLFQRAEDVLDIRRGARLMPSTHNFLSADNQTFNSIGTDLGAGTGNTGLFSSGFSRVRQGVSPTDPRLPLDGTQPDELVVISGTVDSAAAGSLTETGAFASENFAPPALNFRLDNPSLQGSEYIVTIIGGDGYRQTRRIASNTNDTLTLEEDWGVTPSAGDLYEVYEIVAMPEAINPSAGYTANWNNKAASADDGRLFGRQQRVIFILERLAADGSIDRDDLRQLNKDVAGLEGRGNVGRYLVPRIREAVDGVGNDGNGDVDAVLEALETHQGSPLFGRGFVDPVTATTIAGEGIFLGGDPFGPEVTTLVRELSDAIYADEFATTGISPGGGQSWLDRVQHAIDSAAGGPTGAYSQTYSGDYFNGADWRVVVRDAFADTITTLGGLPADGVRGNDNFAHPLAALFTNLVFDPTPAGNRGIWEQIVEVGPVVLGEMVFPLGQSGFI
ncbi:MAG: penicillin acylase family protein, partial [Chloroflexi bacterium]|nr:penicillin acylase family protein [Chloroflexota bacterium]